MGRCAMLPAYSSPQRGAVARFAQAGREHRGEPPVLLTGAVQEYEVGHPGDGGRAARVRRGLSPSAAEVAAPFGPMRAERLTVSQFLFSARAATFSRRARD